jgi:cytochrome c oxidase cbb3-type subunit 3
MNEFTSGFWSVYISVITLVSIVACALLLVKYTSQKLAPGQKAEVTGHVWDENLQEFNNPLPRWWLWLFYITLVFGVVYLILYPGLGGFPGILKWSSHGQYDNEMAKAKEKYDPIFTKYGAMDLRAVAADAQARDMGERIFLNNCAQCHASDGGGRPGFPNLRDSDWQWGGEPEQIVQTVTAGRQAVMPPWPQLGDEGIKNVAHYVLSLSGKTHDSMRAAQGKEIFTTNCAACHGPEGKGNPALGAPNLTDNVWLYGSGGESTIIETVTKGRGGVMPAWGDFLGKDKINLVAGYVYAMSHGEAK